MGYVKSTNEFINTPYDVWESLYNHLGTEYVDEVKNALISTNGEYVDIETYNNDIANWEEDFKTQQKYTKRLESVIKTNASATRDIINYIRSAKRLDRASLEKKLNEVMTDLYNFTY